MAAYDLEEQEQLAEIKAWWKQYGNLLMNVLTAAALTVLAWQGWNWYQRNQSAQASQVYHVLSVAVQDNDSQRIKAASGELLEKFSGSTYASLGALSASKAMIDAGDAKTARVQLQWVVDKGKDELRELARLRLATLLLDEKAYDEALKLLDGKVDPAFEGQGIGSAIARYALDQMLAAGTRKALPICPFIKGYIQRHPQYLEVTYGARPSRAD